MPDVSATISALRAVVGAKNDAELARRLKLDQSTISTWKARGRVPKRFLKLIEASGVEGPVPSHEVWPALHDRATAVALVRYVMLRKSLATSGSPDKALAAFLDVRPFWLIMNRCVIELRGKMELLAVDLPAAAALLIQEDLRDPDATAERIAAQIEEDFSDNPHLMGNVARGEPPTGGE